LLIEVLVVGYFYTSSPRSDTDSLSSAGWSEGKQPENEAEVTFGAFTAA